MAKKSQTKARRNNTQAGQRVVNFYNHGTVNVDARQNNSKSYKHENNGCTVNYPGQQKCHFTLKDQIEDGHPILDKINSVANKQSLPGAPTPVAIPESNSKDSRSSSLWVWRTVGAIFILAAVAATVKYLNN